METKNFDKFLVCLIGEQLIGVSVASVKEVINKQSISITPGVKDGVTGLINLRGSIITLIDLSFVMNNIRTDLKNIYFIAIIEDEDNNLSGFMVDKVDGVITATSTDIEVPPVSIGPPWSKVAQGLIREDRKTIIIVDTTKINEESLREE